MITIIWDVDDVLNSLMSEWLTHWKAAHPTCRLSYAGVTENPPHRVLGISESEYLDSLDRFRLSDAGRSMPPNPDVLEWFHRSGHRYRHVALTARPLHTAPPAAEWVLRHFGDFIRVVAVAPCRRAPDTPRYDTSKGEFLNWWGRGDVLIDDSAANIDAARRAGVRGILFPQPWNSSCDSPAGALRALAGIELTCT